MDSEDGTSLGAPVNGFMSSLRSHKSSKHQQPISRIVSRQETDVSLRSHALSSSKTLDEEHALYSVTKGVPEKVKYHRSGVLNKLPIVSTNRIPNPNPEQQDKIMLAWNDHGSGNSLDPNHEFLQWLHLEKTCLEFKEFQDLTLESRYINLDTIRKDVARQCLLDVQRLYERRFWRGKYLEPISYQTSHVHSKVDASHTAITATFVNLPLFALYDTRVNGNFRGSRDSPRNPVRSLLQYFYRLDTTERRDQRQTINMIASAAKNGRYIHVPHLWALLVNNETLITCAPMSFEHLRGVTQVPVAGSETESPLFLMPYSQIGPYVKYIRLDGKHYFFPLRQCPLWMDLVNKLASLSAHPSLIYLAVLTPTSPYGLVDTDSNELDSVEWEKLASSYLNSQDDNSVGSIISGDSMITVRLAKLDLSSDEGDEETDSCLSARSFDEKDEELQRPSRWDIIREQIKQSRLKRQTAEAFAEASASDEASQASQPTVSKKDVSVTTRTLSPAREHDEGRLSQSDLTDGTEVQDIRRLPNADQRLAQMTRADANLDPLADQSRSFITQVGLVSGSVGSPSNPIKIQNGMPKISTFSLENPEEQDSQQDLLGLMSDEPGREDESYPQAISARQVDSARPISSPVVPVIKPLFMTQAPDLGEAVPKSHLSRSRGPKSDASESTKSGHRRSTSKHTKFKAKVKGRHHRRHISESPTALSENEQDPGIQAGLLSTPTWRKSADTMTTRDSGREKGPTKQSPRIPVTAGQKKLEEASRRLNSLEHVTYKPIYSWPVEGDQPATGSILEVHHGILMNNGADVHGASAVDYNAIEDCQRNNVEDVAIDCAIAADFPGISTPRARFLRTKCDLYIISRDILHCFVEQGIDSLFIRKYWGTLYEICNLDYDELIRDEETHNVPADDRFANVIDHVKIISSEFFKLSSRRILRIVEADTSDPFPYQIPISLLNTLRYVFAFYMVVLKQKNAEHRNFDKIKKAGDLIIESLRQARRSLFYAHNKAANLWNRVGDEALNPESLFALIVENCLRIGAPDKGLSDEKQYLPEVFDIVDLYSGYVSYLMVQARDHARLRVYEHIKLAEEEVNIIARILDAQGDVIRKFKGLTCKDVSLLEDRSKRRISAKIYELKDEFRELQEHLETARWDATQAIQLKTEANNTAILVFTTVTIIFLPMSFVAGYFGMNSVTKESTSQQEFWEISIPVTLVILIVALIVAYYTSWMPVIKRKMRKLD